MVRVCLFVPCGHLLGKGWLLGSCLWCITVSLSLSHWYPGSGVVLDCIDSWSLHPYLLNYHMIIHDFLWNSYMVPSYCIVDWFFKTTTANYWNIKNACLAKYQMPQCFLSELVSLLNFVFWVCKGSDKTFQICRLIWAFAGCLCDNYQKILSLYNTIQL